jgi:amino acid transporter
MSRIVYAMASDGLLISLFAKVNIFKTPTFAVLATGVSSSILALLLDLNELIEMMSIGTLMAYTMVSICVIVLRFRPENVDKNSQDQELDKQSFSVVTLLNEIYIQKHEICSNKTSLNANISTFISG